MNPHEQQTNLNSVCRRLVVLRTLMIAGLGATAAIAHFGLDIALPLAPMATGAVVLALFNAWLYRRLHRGDDVTARAVLAQLLVDVAVLTLLLYCAGGSANPFVSLYLLPLVVAAVLLPRHHALVMALATVVCYSALMFWHLPLTVHPFRLHVIGMWCNFVLSAGLIAFFVARMATALRAREQELSAERERALQNEQLVALGALAAGAAHELATPLATIAVLTREMETNAEAEQADNLRCLRAQVEACKTTLARLRNYGETAPNQDAATTSLDALVQGLVNDWRLLRPAVPVTCRWRGPKPAPQVCRDEGFGQTLRNLINNAADASPAGLSIESAVVEGDLVIEIQDSGAGVAADIAALARRAGGPSTATGGEGRGMGLFLANASIARLGGRIQWVDRADGGVCTRLGLPLQSLAPA